MKKNRIITVVLVLAVITGLCLTGCSGMGRTKQEVHRDHYNTVQHQLWQMQDDVDAVFMLDRPNRLSEKIVR